GVDEATGRAEIGSPVHTTVSRCSAALAPNDDVVGSFDHLALTTAMARLVAVPDGGLTVDDDGGGPLGVGPHVGAAGDGVDSDVIDADGGAAVDEDVGGSGDCGTDARMGTSRAAVCVLLNLRFVS